MPNLKTILKCALYAVIVITSINAGCCIFMTVIYFFIIPGLLDIIFVRHYAILNLFVLPIFIVFAVTIGLFHEKHYDKTRIFSIICCSLMTTFLCYCFIMLMNILGFFTIAAVEVTPIGVAFSFYQECWAFIVAGIFLGLMRQHIWKLVLLLPLFILHFCLSLGTNVFTENLIFSSIVAALIIVKVIVEMIVERIKSKRVVPTSS